ncbi:hypothetical protein [Paraburkholderia aromaticivorans]|uniref:hypothetical protein n=1 Tax=Paraburkholderia aromaticivorans TaxID=2026199 RepID=UPI0038BAF025
MNISLDFDGTYTEDPQHWNQFIDSFLEAGHTVQIITMRAEHETNRSLKDLAKKIPVHFTDRKAKLPYAIEKGFHIDVWIDDNPMWIYQDAKQERVDFYNEYQIYKHAAEALGLHVKNYNEWLNS